MTAAPEQGFDIAQRLRERTACAIEHQKLMQPDTGLGWKGQWCPKCGFRFFGEWDADWA